MSITIDDYVAAAGQFVPSQGNGCILSIWELLDELSGNFGDRLPRVAGHVRGAGSDRDVAGRPAHRSGPQLLAPGSGAKPQPLRFTAIIDFIARLDEQAGV
jgi:hypothetical protein